MLRIACLLMALLAAPMLPAAQDAGPVEGDVVLKDFRSI
jgi:hypothetical protein